MAFKDVLVQLRQQRGWSQQDLADAAEVHVQIVKRYEAGQSLPTLDTLARIARCLGVSTDVLVFDEGGGIAGNVLDDAELLDLFRQIGRLRAQEREAIRVVLRGLVEYAKVRGPEEVKEPKEPPACRGYSLSAPLSDATPRPAGFPSRPRHNRCIMSPRAGRLRSSICTAMLGSKLCAARTLSPAEDVRRGDDDRDTAAGDTVLIVSPALAGQR